MLQMDSSFCYIGLKIQLAALQNSDSDDPKREACQNLNILSSLRWPNLYSVSSF